MQFKDYYETLGVEPSAGDAEIKTAYRRLARKYHPDVSKEPGAEEKFKSINEAYEALRDPPKRKAYDQLRTRGYRPGDEVHAPPGGFGQQGQGGFDYDEVFAGGGAGGGFSDFFEELFGRRRAGGFGQHPGAQPGRGPQPRSDTRAKLAVPLEAVYRGDSVRIALGGKTLDVRIPKGVREGQVIRLAGQGERAGDLLLEIEYAAHPKFEVDGRNIFHVLPVAPWEAALGATISVPTLGGSVDLKIPAGSEAGRKLRLRGRGLPGGSLVGKDGDQIVELEIQAPTPHDLKQREAYEKIRAAFADDWRRE
jgi:curved DNA-binding protein